MKQKEKILIGLTSLFCGSPIIFFTFRNNNQSRNKQQHNLEKEEKDENFQESSSSFLFWIIFIILLFAVAVIIFGVIYKSRQKSKKNPKTKKKEKNIFNLFEKNNISLQNKQIKDDSKLNNANFVKNLLFLNEPLTNDIEIKESLKQKESLKFYFSLSETKISIVAKKNPGDSKTTLVDKIINKDFNNRQPLSLSGVTNNNFYSNFPVNNLQAIIKAMIDFLETYLTPQIISDHYNNKGSEKNGVLAEIVKDFCQSPKTDRIVSYSIIFAARKEISQKASDEDLNKINQNQHKELLKDILSRNHSTFIEYKIEEQGNHHLFLRTFWIYRIINLLYEQISDFMLLEEKYENLRKQMKDDKEKIDKLINIVHEIPTT